MPLQAAYIVPHPPLIIPEIGRGEERKISSTINSYQEIAKSIAEIKPDTIIISSPHAASYQDYIQVGSGKSFSGNFSDFGSSLTLEASSNQEFIKDLESLLNETGFPGGRQGKSRPLDHGVLVPLYFINKVYQDYKLVIVSISGLSLKTHYDFGRIIEKVIGKINQKTVYIASGDLSHKLIKEGPYGFAQEGLDFDERVIDIIKNNELDKFMDFEKEFLYKAAECGLRSFVIMAGVLSSYRVKSKLLSYEGPFGVGYAVAEFIPLDTVDKLITDPYVLLAKTTLENYVLKKKRLEVSNNLPKEMLERQAGVFVSLKKFGFLRGCIGTTTPTRKSIADEIIQNTISSGTRDPRFPQVKASELSFIEYSVDVLLESTKVKDKSELDPEKFGVIVSYKNKSGLLLPNLDGVDTVYHQLEIALEKAGISKNLNFQIEKFEVIRHK